MICLLCYRVPVIEILFIVSVLKKLAFSSESTIAQVLEKLRAFSSSVGSIVPFFSLNTREAAVFGDLTPFVFMKVGIFSACISFLLLFQMFFIHRSLLFHDIGYFGKRYIALSVEVWHTFTIHKT